MEQEPKPKIITRDDVNALLGNVRVSNHRTAIVLLIAPLIDRLPQGAQDEFRGLFRWALSAYGAERIRASRESIDMASMRARDRGELNGHLYSALTYIGYPDALDALGAVSDACLRYCARATQDGKTIPSYTNAELARQASVLSVLV